MNNLFDEKLDGKIAIGMSGGVDSSVAALLLKEAGHDVVGVFIKSWEDDGNCPAGEDAVTAAAAADHIGIELEAIDLSEQYRKKVFKPFIDELYAGRTPNPDVWCNTVIKFGAFVEYAQNKLNAKYLATGHYARVDKNPTRLLKSEDENKDQSYFLYRIQEQSLASAVFPLGNLRKEQVREIAKNAKLPNAERSESMGICFIGKRNFKDFISQHMKLDPGPIISLDDKKKLATHEGASLYTIGQRHGLGIGGPGEPWYVAAKDVTKNEVSVVRGHNHPALFVSGCEITNCHWILENLPKTNWVYTCRYRHRMEPEPCTIVQIDETTASISFAAPQRAVAPGQAAVIYDGVHCLGGGTISSAV